MTRVVTATGCLTEDGLFTLCGDLLPPATGRPLAEAARACPYCACVARLNP